MPVYERINLLFMPHLKSGKYWVFDLDGTLVDSFQHYFNTLEIIFADHGKKFTPDLQMPALTELLIHFFKNHLGAANVDSALEKLQLLSNDSAKTIQPFTGVFDILASLKQNGSKIAVWTNRDYVSAELILKHSGLHLELDAFVSGTCTARRKPHSDGLLRVIEQFKCEPHEITMVGDHEHDVIAAKSIGARSVRASWHSYWKMDPCEHADHQFHSLDHFHQWVKK